MEKITNLIQSEQVAKSLLVKASKHEKKDPLRAEIKRLVSNKINLDRKMEMLTERLSELPEEVPAKPIYDKMKRLQTQLNELDSTLLDKRAALKTPMERVVDFESWKQFLKSFGEIFKTCLDPDQQARLIRTLVDKIELGAKDLKIHYFVGEDSIQQGLVSLTGPDFVVCNGFKKFSSATCSSSLTNGGPYWDRTSDLFAASEALSQLS